MYSFEQIRLDSVSIDSKTVGCSRKYLLPLILRLNLILFAILSQADASRDCYFLLRNFLVCEKFPCSSIKKLKRLKSSVEQQIFN